MLIWYDLVWNNNLGYVRLNGSYNILKSINFQVAGIPSLCKEKNMNVKSMSYTGKVLWTVWELDVEDYEILCCVVKTRWQENFISTKMFDIIWSFPFQMNKEIGLNVKSSSYLRS